MRARQPYLLALLQVGIVFLSGSMVVAHAQVVPFPVVLVVSGPSAALAGQEITYSVHYRLTQPEAVPAVSFVFAASEHLTYVSSHIVSGDPGNLTEPSDGRRGGWDGLGSPGNPEGEVAITVRIEEGFTGTVGFSVLILGTETHNPESRTTAETQVIAAGASLPETGTGQPSPAAMPFALMVLLGGALAAVGALSVAATFRSPRRGD